jgi:hypothetical protein
MGAKKVDLSAEGGDPLGYNPHSRARKKCVYWRMMHMPDKAIKSYDIIFIGAGTNDWNNMRTAINKGNINSEDPATISGALNLILSRITTVSPNTKIVIETPIHRYKYANVETGEFIEWVDCDSISNRYGWTLQDYRKAIKRVARKYNNTYIINGKSLTKSSEMQSKYYTNDGIHPKYYYGKNILSKRFIKKLNKAMGE